MLRRKLIAANWKMNKTISEAAAFAQEMRRALRALPPCDIVVFPSFFGIRAVSEALAGFPVGVGSQDLFWEASGAFTGEVSAAMLADAGATYVLIGHSERRHVIGESDEQVAHKLGAALAGGLSPILCVGETLPERENGRHLETVERQLGAAFSARTVDEAGRTVVAYEPVWAIGTGRTATADDAEVMHRSIRKWVGTRFGGAVAARMRIQYGGSVKPGNAGELLTLDEIDGLLVGGASLDVASFLSICAAVAPVR